MALRKTGLLIFAAVLLIGCRPKPSATIVPDPALMPLIPPDTVILTGLRIAEIKKTPVYQKLVAEQKLPQLDEFTRETGIDPRKDIWEIVLASNGKDTIALVRGKFTEGGITDSGKEPELYKKGIRRFAYKGYTLAGDDRVAVTFLNSSVAVTGPTEAVKRVIDARDGSRGRAPAELIQRVKQIPSTNQIWAVSVGGWKGTLPENLSGAFGGLRKMPIDIREIVAALDLSSGVKFSSEVLSGDAGSAQKMNDAIRGMIGVGRLTTPDDRRDLLKFYDAIEVNKENDRVTVQADVPMDLFQRFLDMYRTPRLG